MSYTTREEWLEVAAQRLCQRFEVAQQPVPNTFKVSCGFPSRSALGTSKRRVGECWSREACADDYNLVFISPVLSSPIEALGTLLHELVHVAVGVEAKHGHDFKVCALAVGLQGKMTATTLSEGAESDMHGLSADLGPYPQPVFDPKKSGIKKQTTRMHKVACPSCGYTARVAAKWIDLGCPKCPCGVEMEEVEQGGEG
jgi:hypothetical protein